MTERRGNAAWRALSDECVLLPGDPADDEPDERPATVGDVWAAWLRTFGDDVTAGRVTWADLVDTISADLAGRSLELCPECACRPVRPAVSAGRHGLCATCWERRLRDGHLQRLADLEAETAALRESNAAKQSIRRRRDVLEPDRQRHAGPGSRSRPTGDYHGRFMPDTADPFRAWCATCGRDFIPHDDDPDCAECRQQRERRHPTERKHT